MASTWGSSWKSSWKDSWGLLIIGLQGTSASLFSLTGEVGGLGVLQGESDYSFDTFGLLAGPIRASGTVSFKFEPSSTIEASGSLEAASHFEFDAFSSLRILIQIEGEALFSFSLNSCIFGYDVPYEINEINSYMELYPKNHDTVAQLYEVTTGQGPLKIYEENVCQACT